MTSRIIRCFFCRYKCCWNDACKLSFCRCAWHKPPDRTCPDWSIDLPLFSLAASMMMAMEVGYYAAMRSFRAVVEEKGLSLKPDMRAQRDRIICAYTLECLATGMPAHVVMSKACFFHQVRLHVRSLPNEEQ